ncbi:MAG: hypothetical protein R3F37_05940 [Candidatus Competibacteraceae bacterium]
MVQLPMPNAISAICNARSPKKSAILNFAIGPEMRPPGAGEHTQNSRAITIEVIAQDENGKKLGNKLTIANLATGTMNLEKEKKADFNKIRIKDAGKNDPSFHASTF